MTAPPSDADTTAPAPSTAPGETSGRALFAAGAFLAAIGVGLGAFAGHALASRVEAGLLETFHTATRYHLVHAVAVLALALGAERWRRPGLIRAGWLILAGVALFSGSLYLLVLTGARGLGAVTPVGGVLLIGGWVFAGVSLVRRR